MAQSPGPCPSLLMLPFLWIPQRRYKAFGGPGLFVLLQLGIPASDGQESLHSPTRLKVPPFLCYLNSSPSPGHANQAMPTHLVLLRDAYLYSLIEQGSTGIPELAWGRRLALPTPYGHTLFGEGKEE